MARVKILLPAHNPTLNDYGGCGNCNTSLIQSEEKWIIVDPGIWPVGMRGYLHYVLKKEGLKPEDIDIVVNTHLHFDHSDNDGKYSPDKYTIPVDTTEHNEFLVGTLDLQKIYGNFQLTEEVRIIETPGHTPGSISIIIETIQGPVALIGDLAIQRQDYIERRLPQYVRDKEATLKSHEKIRSLKPSVVIPGHDLPIWDLCKFPIPMKNFELTKWFPE
jgi:glyoxylase-like metal-dependent hydrolase (beta-lactamase superfamily II)